jgi:Fe-S-cluster containining protein
MDNLLVAISLARSNPECLRELQSLLESAERDVVALGLICGGCGTCCDFAAAGHRLYASTAEIALLLSVGSPPEAPELRCPYQQKGRCVGRTVRPLGCRMYFCNEDDLAYQAIYERTHERIGELHQREEIPYRYVELTAALGQWRSGPEGKKKITFHL